MEVYELEGKMCADLDSCCKLVAHECPMMGWTSDF